MHVSACTYVGIYVWGLRLRLRIVRTKKTCIKQKIARDTPILWMSDARMRSSPLIDSIHFHSMLLSLGTKEKCLRIMCDWTERNDFLHGKIYMLLLFALIVTKIKQGTQTHAQQCPIQPSARLHKMPVKFIAIQFISHFIYNSYTKSDSSPTKVCLIWSL